MCVPYALERNDMKASGACETSLVELLQARALRHGERVFLRFLVDGEGEEETLTFTGLHAAARELATSLPAPLVPGSRAVLLYPPGLDFVRAFMACLHAGVVAVPAYPPDPRAPDATLARLRNIVRDCTPEALLASSSILEGASRLRETAPELESLPWVATDALPRHDRKADARPAVDSKTLAFLQYTSGSTGKPSGVLLHHGNVIANAEAIATSMGISDETVAVNWLPLYHDMGLIGNILAALYAGAETVLFSPLHFVQRPIRWLRAIHRFRATVCGGPNFAYELCLRRIREEDLRELDLRSLEVAYNGAEPVSADTLQRFAKVFGRCGFRPEAFYPCYGLAEATLLVAGASKEQRPTVQSFDRGLLEEGIVSPVPSCSEGARVLVGCGAPSAGQRVAIVEPESGREAAPDRVGEIWVAGPSVGQGYWGRPEETAARFGARLDGEARNFLRTGDLGFFHEGELFVAGRIKDLIIVRGRNVHPHDVEATVAGAHPCLRPGCGAAFAVPSSEGEKVVVVQEVSPSDEEPHELLSVIRRAVARTHEIELAAVALTVPRSVPKTSSGKVRRRACRSQFLAGELSVVTQWGEA